MEATPEVQAVEAVATEGPKEAQQPIELTKTEVDNLGLRINLINQLELQLFLLKREQQIYFNQIIVSRDLNGNWQLHGNTIIPIQEK